MNSTDIFAMRRSGQKAEALAAVREHYPANREDEWYLRAYAWCLYDHVKDLGQRHVSKRISLSELNTAMDAAYREFMGFGRQIRMDSSFTMMTHAALKVHKDWTHFLGFAWWVKTPDFHEDPPQNTDESKSEEFEPIRDRFIRAVASAAVQHRSNAAIKPEWVQWGISLLDSALAEGSNDIWLTYYKSTLAFEEGKHEEALRLISTVVRRQQKATWAWNRLAELLESSCLEDALTCLIHAANVVHEEQEVAKVRVQLARKLKDRNRLEEAAMQVNLALQYRTKGGYSIGGMLREFSESTWYRSQVDANTMRDLPDVTTAAKKILNSLDKSNLTYKTGWIDHHNRTKHVCIVRTDSETVHLVQHEAHPQCVDWEPGLLVDMGFKPKVKSPLDIRLSEATDIPGICVRKTGPYSRVPGKTFGFIKAGGKDIFIPPELATQTGAELLNEASCLAVMAKDMKKNTPSPGKPSNGCILQ